MTTESEYIIANINDNCLTSSNLATNASICKTTNYLYKSEYSWALLSPQVNSTQTILIAYSAGNISSLSADSIDGSVRPVLFLESSISLTGTGSSTSDTIYKIQ